MTYFKYIFQIGILFYLIHGTAQDALHNYGNMQLHDGAQVGLHFDLINDGVFDQNLGLVGFYDEVNAITVSGTSMPIFYDTEIVVDNGLFLETSVGVINNANLITGDVITPRMQTDVFLDFIDLSFYTGENLMSKVDGYAALMNKAAFTFPVGNEEKLRPLTIESVAINPLAKCAYFFEDPNSPSTFTTIFDTSITASTYLTVSEVEFWHLEGDIPSNVTLSWDSWSNTESLAELVTDLRVVGWSNTSNQWVDLGSTAHTGEMNFGTVTSDLFVPNEYDIITLGGNDDMQENFDMIALGNYLLTPNGDGLNDVLTIEGIEVSTNNVLQIYNRYGLLVYKKENYNNEFDGYSNVELVIKRRSGLPSGIYFYVITFYDLRQKHQGYMYISD